MGKTLFNRLKLGLAGLVLAVGLNGCDNSRETTNSYIPKNDTKENLEENLISEKLKENESLFIFDAKKITGRKCKFSISTQEYFKYKQMNHRNNLNNDLTEWVTYNDTTIKSIATKLTKGLKSPEKKAQRLLKFSQSFIYDTSIEKNRDYIRYPLETIVENNGDCANFAILGAALMKSIGIDVALIYLPPQKVEKSAHMALGINGNFKGSYYEDNGKKYFYAETTNADWNIGEIPEKHKSTKVKFYLVK